MSARWSDETVDALAKVVYDHEQQTYVLDRARGTWDGLSERQRDIWRSEARVRLGHFASLGLLVEPGSEARTEYVAESITVSGAVVRRPVAFDHDELCDRLPEYIAWMRRQTPHERRHRVMSRTVHTGPWRESSPSTAAATASGAEPPVVAGATTTAPGDRGGADLPTAPP